jgi:CheY-like chemotaxis protein
VLDALRADPDTRELRVLILSNSSRELEVTGAEALGVIAYWIKANVSLQELGDRVVKVFAAAEHTEATEQPREPVRGA